MFMCVYCFANRNKFGSCKSIRLLMRVCFYEKLMKIIGGWKVVVCDSTVNTVLHIACIQYIHDE